MTIEEEKFIKELKICLDRYLELIQRKKKPQIFKTKEIWIPANNTFVSIFGLNCSGKSTFVKSNINIPKSITYRHLDADDLIGEILLIFGMDSAIKEKGAEYFLRKLEDLLKLRADLTIVENNNIPTDMRAQILNRMQALYNDSVLLCLNPSWEVIEQQAKARGTKLGIREYVEKEMLDIQLNDPEKYFIGYDRVFITDTPRQAKVFIKYSS